jgi:hypothetical protein
VKLTEFAEKLELETIYHLAPDPARKKWVRSRPGGLPKSSITTGAGSRLRGINLLRPAGLRFWFKLGNVGYFQRAELSVSGGDAVTATAKKPYSRDLVEAVLLLKLSASEKLVLMALCRHYPKIYPSVSRIAALASQSERWVRRCLRTLQKKGLIEVYYRRDGQFQGTNWYTVNPDRILMQASKRAKTTLKSDGTEFRGVGNSLPGEGEELTSAKHGALDKEQGQDDKEQNITGKERSQPTCQEEEIPIDENPYPDDEVVANLDEGGILTDPPYEDSNPCLEEPEAVSSESNSPTHPHPPTSAAPPFPLPPHRR